MSPEPMTIQAALDEIDLMLSSRDPNPESRIVTAVRVLLEHYRLMMIVPPPSQPSLNFGPTTQDPPSHSNDYYARMLKESTT